MSTEAHVIEMIPEYVLGSLAEDEQQRVREHAASCIICREELRRMEEVTARLALATPSATPSLALKSRLLREAGQQRVQRASRPARPFVSWAAVALAALAVVFASTTLVLTTKLRNQRVLTGPLGMRAVALQAADAAPLGSGTVIIGADGRNGALVVDQLPVLPSSQEYQVWLVNEDGMVSAATFGVDEYGYRGARLEAPENLLTYDEIWITIEPAGGSSEPSGPRVLQGKLNGP